MDVYTAIRTRRDMETFSDECPPQDVVARIVEAATWAPNHRLTEPWRFYVVAGDRREALADVIASALAESGEAEGAQRSVRAKLMRAPLTIFVSQAVTDDAARSEERAIEDYAACVAAIQNLLLAAHEEGLIAHYSTGAMIGYPQTRNALGLGPDDRIVAMLNLGYRHADAPSKEGRRNAPIVTWDWPSGA